MIKTKDELIAGITALIGDNTSDEALTFMEDVTDTLSEYEEKVKDKTNWKDKYEENDSMWRKKYAERFTKPSGGEEEDDDVGFEETKKLRFEDLFKVED